MSHWAQHDEDDVLDELLGHPGRGFYIDVGAHHPSSATVTKTFYDKGWNGINLEPLPEYYHMLVDQRPRDINLNLACGDKAEIKSIYVGDGY